MGTDGAATARPDNDAVKYNLPIGHVELIADEALSDGASPEMTRAGPPSPRAGPHSPC
jgi:hypothetical protein